MKWTAEHQENARFFSKELTKNGFNFFTGVPCSLLGALIEELSDKKYGYIAAPREDSAMGLASGAYLAGKLPCILIQNSGFGYSLNVLTSLNLIYKIPMLCLISYRGHGPDAPEHIVMGKSIEKLLHDIGISYTVPDEEKLEKAIEEARKFIEAKREPYVILVKKGIFGA